MTDSLSVRTISPSEHLDFLRTREAVSFLQTPAWARVKPEWRAESIGWFRDGSSLTSSTQGFRDGSLTSSTNNRPGGELVGTALVLYRQLPRVRRYLAYLPEGPVIDWGTDDLAGWLTPMAAHLKQQGAFGIRIGPPVVLRRWSAAQVKEGIADDRVASLTALPPTERSRTGAKVVSQLRELGWVHQAVAGGFAAGQPEFNFVIALRDADGNQRSEDAVLKAMNQLWRRNIKKAAKLGVVVSRGTSADLAAFHELYAHTAARDHFTPRPLAYFQAMHAALAAQHPDSLSDLRLYLAHHEGDLVAATIWIRVGSHTWYSYGASSTDKREVRGSNAVQWQMIRDAIAVGAAVYDLRGITDTLAAGDPHLGLVQFKVGTGGEAVEYAGEWDLPLNRLIHKAFELYLRRRG